MPWTGQQYEYRFITPRNEAKALDELNRLGRVGWRAVSGIAFGMRGLDGGNARILLVREVAYHSMRIALRRVD